MILDEELLESIRALLGVDADTLPDTLLTSPLMGGRVVRDVMSSIGVPGYDARPADEQERIRAAVAYRVAAMALGSGVMREARSVTQERFGQQYSVTTNATAMDVDGWIASLLADASRELGPLMPDTASVMHFRLAPGRRGA